MNFIGVDLHKKSITVCVMDQNRKILARKTLACTQTKEIVEFFRQFRPFKVVLEATASYPWFVELMEPLAEKVVLANPKKLRVIAESTKKTDRLDAQILAEFLVLDMIPESYQPTPRQRQHRALVRHRQYLQGRITSVRSKIRHILSNYNADRKDLFSAKGGPAYFKEVPLSDADRFVIKQLWAEWQDHVAQRLAVTKKLKAFVAKAPHREAEAREILKTAPGVGFVTAEVLLSELGDISRFRNSKMVCAYAGLVPVVRQSGEKKSKNMRITKEGSGLLRWALVEAAWRLVRQSLKWAARFSRLMHRSGKKRAIVAIARKLLCVLYAMLKTSTPYRIVITDMKARRTTGKKLVRSSRQEQTATPQTATATAEQPATPQIAAPRTSRKQSTKAATAKQPATKQPATPQTATAKQPATPRTVASGTAHKQSITTATAEQTTTTPPPAARTTRKKLLTTSPPAQTTTT
jgi:transposase